MLTAFVKGFYDPLLLAFTIALLGLVWLLLLSLRTGRAISKRERRAIMYLNGKLRLIESQLNDVDTELRLLDRYADASDPRRQDLMEQRVKLYHHAASLRQLIAQVNGTGRARRT